jgi:hypothetical protein
MELQITEFTLLNFVRAIEAAVIDGYRINYSQNDDAPTGMIGYYRCKLTRADKVAALLKAPIEKLEDAISTAPAVPVQNFIPSVQFTADEIAAPRKPARAATSRI